MCMFDISGWIQSFFAELIIFREFPNNTKLPDSEHLEQFQKLQILQVIYFVNTELFEFSEIMRSTS